MYTENVWFYRFLYTSKIWPVIAIFWFVRFIKGKFSIKSTCFIDLKSYNKFSLHALYVLFAFATAFDETNELIHLNLRHGLIRFCNVSGEKNEFHTFIFRINHWFCHSYFVWFGLAWLAMFVVRFRFLLLAMRCENNQDGFFTVNSCSLYILSLIRKANI